MNINIDWELVRYIAYALFLLVVYIITQKGKLDEIVSAGIVNGKRFAKEKLKNGIIVTGEQQIDFAVEHFYPLLPKQIKMFVSEDKFRGAVSFTYKKFVDLIDDGKINGSFK